MARRGGGGGDYSTPSALNATSWATAIGRGDDRLDQHGASRVRLTLAGSRTRSGTAGVAAGSAQGLFVEAASRLGRTRHEYGVHLADSNLYFGDNLNYSGNRGAFWRVDANASRRLNGSAGLDYVYTRPDDALWQPGSTRTGINGGLNYTASSRTSFGASLHAWRYRYEGGSAHESQGMRSYYGTLWWQTRFFDWPRTRLSVTARNNQQLVRNSATATGQEVQWEQDWIGGKFETMRPELTTTLGYAIDKSSSQTRRYPTAGLQWRWWMAPRFTVSGNLRYTSSHGNLSTSRGLSGTLNAEKELRDGWSLGASASLNQARTSTGATAWNDPQIYRSSNRSVQVYLRWQGREGSGFAVAGAAPGRTGSGSVGGRVFMDANRDGQRQADEAGVAQVEVILDGRYRTLTDSDGFFEFPQVATGSHRISLTPESVPLPWGPQDAAGAEIEVPLRGRAAIDIPVARVGQ